MWCPCAHSSVSSPCRPILSCPDTWRSPHWLPTDLSPTTAGTHSLSPELHRQLLPSRLGTPSPGPGAPWHRVGQQRGAYSLARCQSPPGAAHVRSSPGGGTKCRCQVGQSHGMSSLFTSTGPSVG